MPPDAAFDVSLTAESAPGDTLLVGLSLPGMAGISGVDYLVRHLESEQIGHVSTDAFPDIAPFELGEPRHHTRLFAIPETDMTAVISEVFVPVWAAEAYVDGLLGWAETAGLEEVVVPYGVPFPHGPDEHVPFYVATERYRERRLADTDIDPLVGGFLDGVVGEFVVRELEETGVPVGVLVTPAHLPGPDLDAGLRLLQALQDVYGFSVDLAELEQLSEEMRRYYAELADRMDALAEPERGRPGQDYPEDRMYM